MKRKDQILAVSLALFNDEGESAVTAVDIANELDISPGNLYYHFRGKDEILVALFDRFERELQALLAEALSQTELRDAWLALYVLAEHQYDYRFLYRDMGAALRRLPPLARRFQHLAQRQRSLMERLVPASGSESPASAHQEPLRQGLVSQLLMTLTFWLEFQTLIGCRLDRAEAILSTMEQLMIALWPHVDADTRAIMEECHALYGSQTGS